LAWSCDVVSIDEAQFLMMMSQNLAWLANQGIRDCSWTGYGF
jgi:hypothetical protein